MNYLEAIQALREGKRVSREGWVSNTCLGYDKKGGVIAVIDDNRDLDCTLDINNLLAEDYYVVNENLSKSITKVSELPSMLSVLLVKDVKVAIKRYMEWLKESSMQNPRNLYTKAKEIFGDELV